MSDVLDRLRADIAYQKTCSYPSQAEFNEDLLEDAAAEITRLRAIEACARKVADTAMMSNNMNQMFVSGRAIDELRKALGEK